MYREIFYRELYLDPIITGVIVQVVKVVLYSIVQHRFAFERFTQADGFPSLHAGVFSSLATCVGIKYGYSSILFSVVTTYSVIIIHDTLRLKGEKGKQAYVLNELLQSVEQYSGIGESLTIKVLRYRPLDVLSGVVIGIIFTMMVM